MKITTLLLFVAVFTGAAAQSTPKADKKPSPRKSAQSTQKAAQNPSVRKPEIRPVTVSEQFGIAALRAEKAIDLLRAGPPVEQSRVRGLFEEADVQRRNAADDAVWQLLGRLRFLAALTQLEFQNNLLRLGNFALILGRRRAPEYKVQLVAINTTQQAPDYKAAEICKQEIETSIREGMVKPDAECLKPVNRAAAPATPDNTDVQQLLAEPELKPQ